MSYGNDQVKSIQIAAFWKSKPGSKAIATGKMKLPDGRELFLTLIPNGYKKQANHPDFVVLAQPATGGQANSTAAADPFAQTAPAQVAPDPFAKDYSNPDGTEVNPSAETDDWF